MKIIKKVTKVGNDVGDGQQRIVWDGCEFYGYESRVRFIGLRNESCIGRDESELKESTRNIVLGESIGSEIEDLL